MEKKIKIIDILCYISIGDYDKLPKKVRYEEINWKLELNSYCGVDYSDETQYMFADYIDKNFLIQEILNDEVEILDEEDEFEDIEEIEIKEIEESSHLEFKERINSLIKNQKKIISRLKDE